MFVADLGVDLLVENLDAAERQMDFVEAMGGFIAATGDREWNGEPGRIVELRVPHRQAGRVTEILRNEFGQVLSINVFSAEVSVRHARLLRQLEALKQALPGLSGEQLRRAKDEIEVLEDIVTFQLRRVEYLYVEVHLIQAP
jgi:hypothetical protein